MLVPWDVLQRKLCCGGACVFQVHSVAVPGVTLFRCQSPGVLEQSGLCWVRRCFCLHNSFCNARPLSCRIHRSAWLQNMLGGGDSVAVLLLSVHWRMRVRSCIRGTACSHQTHSARASLRNIFPSSWTANFFALLIILLKKPSACAKADMQPDRTGKKKRNNFLHLPVSLFLKW